MSQKIYTKTGDSGKTSLIGGTKVSKSNTRIDAYGTIDELNSFLGLVRDNSTDERANEILKEIQDRLFTIGSALACDPNKETKLHIPDLREEDITLLENEMDKMNENLPEMRHFILPGGHPLVSITHVARSICRRAERCCVKLQENEHGVEVLILKYLNRLSDYLFVLSRFYSHNLQASEIAWFPRI